MNTCGTNKLVVYSVPGTGPSTLPHVLLSRTLETRRDWPTGTLLDSDRAGISGLVATSLCDTEGTEAEWVRLGLTAPPGKMGDT